jgi:hypothetical protein
MVKGQKFIAIQDTYILYTFKNGGGINGRKVKKGEEVTFLTESIEISTRCVTFYETLYKVPMDDFTKLFIKK